MVTQHLPLTAADTDMACCRAHVGVHLRDPGLDVSDINQYMLHKPIGRDVSPLAKGHPAGPRLVSPVKARCDPALQDNSLRTTDIEGCAPGRWGGQGILGSVLVCEQLGSVASVSL